MTPNTELALRRAWVANRFDRADMSDDEVMAFRPLPSDNFRDGFKAGAEHAARWISVEGRLPEDNEPKLVYIADIGILPELSHTIAYYEKDAWHFLDEYYYDCKVSHWLPIPNKPCQ